MLKRIVNSVGNFSKDTDYWITNETFYTLANSAKEIRITDEGFIELSFEGNLKIAMELGKCIFFGGIEVTSHAQVMYVEEDYNKIYEADVAMKDFQKKFEIL